MQLFCLNFLHFRSSDITSDVYKLEINSNVNVQEYVTDKFSFVY